MKDITADVSAGELAVSLVRRNSLDCWLPPATTGSSLVKCSDHWANRHIYYAAWKVCQSSLGISKVHRECTRPS